MTVHALRSIPSVSRVMEHPVVQATGAIAELRSQAAREELTAIRAKVAEGTPPPDLESIVQATCARIRVLTRGSLNRVLNATGVVIHTNLGRAPMNPSWLSHAAGYCNLEYDLAAGRRGSRRDHVESLLVGLSGAESALVVNNNAGAVFLMLAALAAEGEVIISRGQLVEIGGSFRVPEIMEASRATLREVGTTNRTYTKDYAAAIGPATKAILMAHPSNFLVSGFVHKPTTEELAQLADAKGLHLLYDLGTGTFGPLPDGLVDRCDPVDELRQGAHLVSFSGDKLMGGPQAGIILGRKDLIDRLARHPLARALRADKLALACLEQVLLCYRTGASDDVPVSRMLNASEHTLKAQADALAARLKHLPASPEVTQCLDPIGGGSHPEETLAGWAVSLRPTVGGVDALADRLRGGAPPLVGVIKDDRLHLHVRTLDPDHEDAVVSALQAAFEDEN